MNRSYKIAIVSDFFPPRIGGIELHARDLALELMRRGHTAHVITTFPGPDEVDGIQVHRLDASLLPGADIIWNTSPLKKLRQLLERENFDVLHAHASILSPLAYGGIAVARRLKIPSVLTNHSLFSTGSFFAFRTLDFCLRFSRWPFILAAVSRTNAERLHRAVPKDKIHVLHNGIHPSEWEVAKSSGRRPRLVTVMRLNKKKHAHHLIRAIPRINAQLPPHLQPSVVIVGDGPRKAHLLREAKELGIDDQIEFLGYRPRHEIKKILGSSDLFVLPSTWESCPIVLLEARSAGLPIVAMNHGGVGDIVEQGNQGFLADTREEFVRHIATILKDPSLKLRLAESAKVGMERFGWDKVIESHLDVYQLAIEKCQEVRSQEIKHESLSYDRHGARLSPLPYDLSRD